MEDVNKSIELIELKNGNNPGPLSMILDPPLRSGLIRRNF